MSSRKAETNILKLKKIYAVLRSDFNNHLQAKSEESNVQMLEEWYNFNSLVVSDKIVVELFLPMVTFE